MPPNDLAGGKAVHLPFIAWQTLADQVRLGAAAPPMISCLQLGCAGNLCCKSYGLLSPLGLAAWVALATSAVSAMGC